MNPALAQEKDIEDNSESFKSLDNVEKMLEKDFPAPAVVEEELVKRPDIKQNQKASYTQLKENKSSQLTESTTDMAALQKTYMPKSNRWQLNSGLTLNMSDAFYRTLGLNLKLTYHLTESWGLEVFGQMNNSFQRDELNSLQYTQQMSVQNLVTLKSLMGANIYFNTLYGKFSVNDSRIVPYEIYQSLGYVKVTNQDNQEYPGFYLGIGELISLSRSSAFRIDLSWYFYSTKNILGQSVSDDSLFINFGYSWFFPEPRYR